MSYDAALSWQRRLHDKRLEQPAVNQGVMAGVQELLAPLGLSFEELLNSPEYRGAWQSVLLKVKSMSHWPESKQIAELRQYGQGLREQIIRLSTFTGLERGTTVKLILLFFAVMVLLTGCGIDSTTIGVDNDDNDDDDEDFSDDNYFINADGSSSPSKQIFLDNGDTILHARDVIDFGRDAKFYPGVPKEYENNDGVEDLPQVLADLMPRLNDGDQPVPFDTRDVRYGTINGVQVVLLGSEFIKNNMDLLKHPDFSGDTMIGESLKIGMILMRDNDSPNGVWMPLYIRAGYALEPPPAQPGQSAPQADFTLFGIIVGDGSFQTIFAQPTMEPTMGGAVAMLSPQERESLATATATATAPPASPTETPTPVPTPDQIISELTQAERSFLTNNGQFDSNFTADPGFSSWTVSNQDRRISYSFVGGRVVAKYYVGEVEVDINGNEILPPLPAAVTELGVVTFLTQEDAFDGTIRINPELADDYHQRNLQEIYELNASANAEYFSALGITDLASFITYLGENFENPMPPGLAMLGKWQQNAQRAKVAYTTREVYLDNTIIQVFTAQEYLERRYDPNAPDYIPSSSVITTDNGNTIMFGSRELVGADGKNRISYFMANLKDGDVFVGFGSSSNLRLRGLVSMQNTINYVYFVINKLGMIFTPDDNSPAANTVHNSVQEFMSDPDSGFIPLSQAENLDPNTLLFTQVQ